MVTLDKIPNGDEMEVKFYAIKCKISSNSY
jgi:hypothetical protein